ncbi:hypothetical protein IAD21_06157 [Abditibacteriota bacterium]|nr:hypothetical protein IAD21_06157 [Abditibacteriota bacterium]
MKICFLFLCLLTFAALPPAQADVTLPAVFSDHAVLQRDKTLPVWGTASPGEAVTVTLGAQQGETTAGADGHWMLELAPQPLSKYPLTLSVTGKNTIKVNDLLLGDVWLCSGQSNMELALSNCDALDDIKAADLPMVRYFRADYNFASTPATELKGRWSVCSPGTAPGFSAVGFYFARKVQAQTGVPIGLLTNAVGGTNIELWIAQDTLLSTPSLAPYAKQMRESLAQYQGDLTASLPSVEKWTSQSRTNLAAGHPVPMPPEMPPFPFGERAMHPRCVTLHNGMIAPLTPFALRGALWYQGENNPDGDLYVEKTRAMLGDWRRWFGDANLPFYFVQLAAWQKPDNNPEGGGWGLIRDAQRRCLSIPHTGMASAIDIGDANDIHPHNKADVGDRLALCALHNEYGQTNLVASGPLYRSMKVEYGKIRLDFDSVGSGLMVGKKVGRLPTVGAKGEPLKRFAIAGENKKWVWAEAVIEGSSVIVSSMQVPNPVAVRYAFSTNPEGANLYNREGLPASPFRTDSW